MGVLLGAAALAVLAFPVRATWWGGWVLAIAEAGIVGGLADWFAVTALFRRPLGLPIPHTALIPTNWELMAARVGSMVGGRVLTTEYVVQEISRVDVAGFLLHGAERIKPSDLEAILATVTRWAAGQLAPASTAELVSWLGRVLRRRPVAPLLADLVELARRQGWDERAIEGVARALADALDRPLVREALADEVDEIVVSYRRQVGGYPGLIIGLANAMGLIDRRRLVSALQAALERIATDPDDPLRARLAQALAGLPARLRSDASIAARVERAKDELLASAAMTRLLEDAAAGLHRGLVADLGSGESGVVAWITDRLEEARQTVLSDPGLRANVDHWLKSQATHLVEAYQGRIAAFIERGVHALGAEGAVRLIEEHAGDDLQYIRVNGTVVGGLAGGAIYGLHLLLQQLV